MNKLINAVRDLSVPSGPPPPVGEQPSIKTFYEGPGGSGCNINWVEKKPSQIRETARRSFNQVAIQAYKVKDRTSQFNTIGGITALKFHSLKIQSPFIIDACREIFEDAGILLAENEPLTFDDPFPALYFAQNKIVRVQQNYEPKSSTYEHLRLLINLMKGVFGDTASQVGKLTDKKLMSFRYTWTLFPKGTIVWATKHGQERLYKIDNIHLGMDDDEQPCWKLKCDYIQFDGNKFGVTSDILIIKMYRGNRLVTNLPAYPIAFCEDESLVDRMVTRGEKVLHYQDVHYQEYAGTAFPAGGVSKRNVSGRIIIDAISYSKHNPSHPIMVGPMFKEKVNGSEKSAKPGPSDQNSTFLPISGSKEKSPESQPKLDGLSHLKRPSARYQESNRLSITRNPQHLALMSPMLPGFSLRDKEWLLFTVDYISEIPWDDEAFDHLVYSQDHKDLLLTFVKNHKDYGRETDDVITGKGQGLILLLSGPPGTGKTLTAEAVADRSRRPLYYLNVEELGTDPAALGGVLSKILSLAIEWNAIVLLDEADVFLARRSLNELARNELVSIFLREMEYYRGILFLTTNLLETIDDAFRSRIHIHLLYPRLSFSSRLTLWKSFIARLGSLPSPPSSSSPRLAEGADSRRSSATEVAFRGDATVGLAAAHALSPADLEKLAGWDLNGREIKNVVKTVRTWCVCKGFDFDLKRLEVGITVTAPFAKEARKEHEILA